MAWWLDMDKDGDKDEAKYTVALAAEQNAVTIEDVLGSLKKIQKGKSLVHAPVADWRPSVTSLMSTLYTCQECKITPLTAG